MRLLGANIGLIVLAGAAHAGTVTFNFEEYAGSTDRRAADIKLLSSARHGVSILLYRENGAGFSVLDSSRMRSRPFPRSWGRKHLSPFGKPGGGAFVANFDVPVTSVRLQFGDFGTDQDMSIVVVAYDDVDAMGEVVDAQYGTWDANDLRGGDDPGSVTVRAGEIRSIVFVGGSSRFAQSLYWDNITVTATANGCPWDCGGGGDGVVDVRDLLDLIAQWGGPGTCDVVTDGAVGIEDLMLLLGQWGGCP